MFHTGIEKLPDYTNKADVDSIPQETRHMLAQIWVEQFQFQRQNEKIANLQELLDVLIDGAFDFES